MKMKRLLSIAVAAGISLAAIGFTNSNAAGNNNGNPPSWSAAAEKNCPPENNGGVTCNSWTLHTFINGKEVQDAREFQKQLKAFGKNPTISPAPVSYSATDLQNVYGVTNLLSGTPTVAIVDVFNSYVIGNLVSDLNLYRSINSMPAATNLSVLNQDGVPNSFAGYASATGWDAEIALDVQMVTAMCPNCKINLYLAKSASFVDLNAAVIKAASTSPAAISNSYGGRDTSGANLTAYTSASSNGIAVTASTGDNGYGVQSPASFTGVIAVGGTTLRNVGTNSWTESAWSGAGSGCSSYSANLKLQQSSATKCANKANADISAVADPYTGVNIIINGVSKIYGGTSASAPIIAAYLALNNAKNYSTSSQYKAFAYVWQQPSKWNDVTTGTNGNCRTLYCIAGSGWDGPTGLGTPRVL